jgi:hypothetical protein
MAASHQHHIRQSSTGEVTGNGRKHMSLNQPQRNALANNLQQLEQSLDEIERLLDSPPAGVTYTTEVDFDPPTIQCLRETCRETRGQIAEIAAAFELPQRRWDGRRIIVAEMSVAWIDLEDMRPPKLRRYGTVDPALNETLAPRLERLMELVLAMRELASPGE